MISACAISWKEAVYPNKP